MTITCALVMCDRYIISVLEKYQVVASDWVKPQL